MIVGLYARVSTDEQNVEQQKDVLIKYARGRGWEYRSYVDYAVSGTVRDRPAWKLLLRDCELKKFDGILVLKIDRITRSLPYAVEFYQWFMQQEKLEFYSVYDGVDLRTADGYFNFMIKCLLAEYELKQLDIRRSIGIERAKKEGKYKGRVKGSKNKPKEEMK